MPIFQIDPLVDSRWSAFVDRHPKSSVFHRSEWLHCLKQTYGYEPAAVTSSPPDGPLTNALVFCTIKSSLTGRRFVSLPFSDHCEALTNDEKETEFLLGFARDKVDQKQGRYFEIRPLTLHRMDRNFFAISTTYFFHCLNLESSEEQLFKALHKDCVQRKIRRADRESLGYEEGTSEKLLGHFYELWLLTRRRQRLPPQPLKWFHTLMASFGKNLRVRVAFKGDRPIASILTLTHRKTITYKYGCSDARFHHLGGTALLFWNTIREAKTQGLEVLDMGRSDVANPGLTAFKERWAAKRSTLAYWTYPGPHTSRKDGWTMKLVGKAVSLAPERSLKLMGSLFYRHAG